MYKMQSAKLRNWQRIKCKMKMRNLIISVSEQPPKTNVVYNVKEKCQTNQ